MMEANSVTMEHTAPQLRQQRSARPADSSGLSVLQDRIPQVDVYIRSPDKEILQRIGVPQHSRGGEQG